MSDEEKEQGENVKEKELSVLSPKHALFIDNYFDMRFNATEAYQATYRCKRNAARMNGARLLANDNIQAHIKARFEEIGMGQSEALALLADQARARLGDLFRVSDEWTFYPLPTYDILEVKEVVDDTDPEKPKTRISYRVRHLVLDIDKILDPKYSHLIREFQDKGKDGMSIKLHDPQAAIDKILRVQGAYRDSIAHTGENGGPMSAIIRSLDYSVFTVEELTRITNGESEIAVYADALKRIATSQSQSGA